MHSAIFRCHCIYAFICLFLLTLFHYLLFFISSLRFIFILLHFRHSFSYFICLHYYFIFHSFLPPISIFTPAIFSFHSFSSSFRHAYFIRCFITLFILHHFHYAAHFHTCRHSLFLIDIRLIDFLFIFTSLIFLLFAIMPCRFDYFIISFFAFIFSLFRHAAIIACHFHIFTPWYFISFSLFFHIIIDFFLLHYLLAIISLAFLSFFLHTDIIFIAIDFILFYSFSSSLPLFIISYHWAFITDISFLHTYFFIFMPFHSSDYWLLVFIFVHWFSLFISF